MAQIIKKIKPITVNTDSSKYDLKETESSFLRGYEIGFGKDGAGDEGGNFGVGKKMASNFKTIAIPLPPTGLNKTIGFYVSTELNEAYVLNWNSDNLHGVYRLDGITLTADVVAIKPGFDFTIDPKHTVPDHRAGLRVIYGIGSTGERVVVEKFFYFTDGHGWQRWIPVIAATATNGFDPVAFPYYKLQPPHFDANELIDYPTRPPMYAPVINPVLPTAADLLLQNRLLKQSVQFAFRYIMNDNRPTAPSWWSEPYFNTPSTCDVDNTSLPRCLDLGLYAGGPNVEKIQLLVRFNGISSNNALGVNTDFALYDTIYKYSTDGGNDPEQIGPEYWTRSNPWSGLNYDPAANMITYRYCGDKGSTLFAPEDSLMVQNDIPLKSMALSNTGDVLLWGDNLRFYPNFDQVTLDNISSSVVDVQSGNNACNITNVKVTLYATFNSICFAYKNGPTDTSRLFGGVSVKNNKLSVNPGQSNGFGLTYGTNDGLICYFAGTNYYAVGKQFKVDAQGNRTELDVVDITNAVELSSILSLYDNGGYIIQQFKFNVPAGHYIARIARHGSDLSSDYQLSSTYVLGQAHWNGFTGPSAQVLQTASQFGLSGTINLTSTSVSPLHENWVDATNGDVDNWTGTKQIFLLFCPFTPVVQTQSWRVIEGYLLDNVDSISGIDSSTTIGVELVEYHATLGSSHYKQGGSYTDHNGFFFVFTADDNDLFDTGTGRSSEVAFDARFGCGPYTPAKFRTQINISKKSGYYPNQIINIADVDSNLGNYIEIKGSVKNCVTGNGISGIGVTMTQCRTYFTDSDGNYTIRLHTFASGIRSEHIYINGNGNCLFSECDCSTIPIIPFSAAGITCSDTKLREAPPIPTMSLKIITIKGTSLKGGGNYPLYMVGHDLAGRKNAPCLIGYQYIPTFLEKGDFNPSQIQLKITGPLKLPDWCKWITFAIGNNLNTSTYIQWVGDKIEFLDGQGNIVADGNGAVRARITIQSLLDFNIRENFATTATYQFVQNDTVRIYDDGQGNLFTPSANKGYLDYQVLGTDFNKTVDPTVVTTTTTSGSTTTIATAQDTYDPKSFIIAYDERLLALKDLCGFWIELNRANPIIDNAPCFGIPGTYPVINGEIGLNTILLKAFDTYYQKRNIIINLCSGADLNHPFESQSITDYWGANVTSAGVTLFKDDLAQQRWYLNDVIKTDAFVNLGRVNGLGMCRSQNRKDFTDQDWGGMVAIHSERNMLIFINENDWFTADFNLNYAHVDQYGRVIANPDLATGIGNPYQKVGDNFGCAFDDAGTIQFEDGYAIWADRKNTAIVFNNYRQAQDISGDNKGYFIEKFKYMVRYNTSIANDLNNIMEMATGINPENGNIYVTFRKRNNLNPSPVNFVNNEREVFYNLSETFVFNPTLKQWTGWTPFTPEFYGKMPDAQSGTEFITFANGEGWFHNSKATKGFMNFYGVETDQVINCISNFDTSKLKVYQSIGLESAIVKYFISSIITDDKKLFSYLTLRYFTKRGNVLYAEIMRNMNTYPDPTKPVVNMLVDGKSINGQYCEFQLVSDPCKSQEYSEINNILVRFIGSEKSEK